MSTKLGLAAAAVTLSCVDSRGSRGICSGVKISPDRLEYTAFGQTVKSLEVTTKPQSRVEGPVTIRASAPSSEASTTFHLVFPPRVQSVNLAADGSRLVTLDRPPILEPASVRLNVEGVNERLFIEVPDFVDDVVSHTVFIR